VPIQKHCATGVNALSEKRGWRRSILNLLIQRFGLVKARYLSGEQVLHKSHLYTRLPSTVMVSIITTITAPPSSTDCRRYGAPFLARGGGTSLRNGKTVRQAPRLEVRINSVVVESALVDVVASSLPFVGARALWDTSVVREVVLSRDSGNYWLFGARSCTPGLQL